MVVEGTILSVMESLPLQLTVESPHGRWHVQLGPDTSVSTPNGDAIGPGELRPGHRVEISGSVRGPHAVGADSIRLHP